MRVESLLPKMESKAMVPGKLALDDDAELPDPETMVVGYADAAAASTPGRVTGKRSTRDEPTIEMYPGATPPPGLPLDMSSVSSLCHELLERKRVMLSQPSIGSSIDGDTQVKASDDDSDSGLKSKFAASPDKQTSEPLTEEDIIKRKAQRRREQVRAASRRCRDRQRRETEELRVKVFQLEEFISHTMQTYEGELRRQRQQFEMLAKENEALRAQLRGAERPSSVASSPASVASMSLSQSLYTVKPEPVVDHPNSGWGEETTDHIVWDPARIQNMHETVEDFKRAVISIAESTVPSVIHRQAFGWNFDFWSEDTRYFVKTRKFFRGMRARDIAERNFNVDYAKYLDTFPEVKAKKDLHQLSPNVKIVQTVKDLPGKGIVSSLTASMISRDEEYSSPGERWAVGIISVGSANHLVFNQEDECNGYIFEDTTCMTSDGREVHGCLVRGAGRYEAKGKELKLLMEDMAKIFASVVIRWESLFINDYMADDDVVVGEIAELEF